MPLLAHDHASRQVLTRRLPYEHVGREEVLRMLLFPEDIPIEKRRPDMSLVCRRLTTVCLWQVSNS